ncbi:MAG: PA0069 family radical SAM protein [Planktomarina sp.]
MIPKNRLQGTARGRGTADNRAGRFEALQRLSVDDGWDGKDDLPPVRTLVQTETARKIITRNTSPDIPFDRSVNPYRGCEHGCIYCFARPSHAYLNLSPGLDFETRLLARPNAAVLLEKELSKPGYTPAPLAFGTNTDPYQPIEDKHKIMRQCLQVLADFNHPVTITTKGALIERDLDILGPMAAKGLARVGVSIPTLKARLSRVMQPRVPAPKRLLQVIENCAGAGVPTTVMVAPVIPGLTDDELETILRAAHKAGAQRAAYIMLRLPHEVSSLFQDWLKLYFPDRFAKVMARVRESHGGRDYDPRWGKRMRGEGEHADMIAKRFDLACKRYGFDQNFPKMRTDLFHVPPRPGDQLSLF